MPVFDYECKNCGKLFDEFVMSFNVSDSEIKCPECGKKDAKRLFSAPSMGSSFLGFSSGSSCGSSGFT